MNTLTVSKNLLSSHDDGQSMLPCRKPGGCQSPAAPSLTTTRLASGIQSSRTAHCICSKQARQLLSKAASDGFGGDGGGGGGVRAIRL